MLSAIWFFHEFQFSYQNIFLAVSLPEIPVGFPHGIFQRIPGTYGKLHGRGQIPEVVVEFLFPLQRRLLFPSSDPEPGERQPEDGGSD